MSRMCAVLALVLAGSPLLRAQEAIAPKVDSAITRGLEFLAQKQQPDGAFEVNGPKLAITGLATMAFMANGHVPGDGRYGPTVRRSLDLLVQRFPEDGYVGKVDGGRMYGQGIVVLTLAEAYGIERDLERRQKIKKVLVKAVEVILAAQNVQKDVNNAGGWRYEPVSADSDLSLSGWNMLALRSCNNIGVTVQRECVDRAASYVLRCYNKGSSGFAYQPSGAVSPAMTGVGVLNLCLMDRASAPEVAGASDYITKLTLNDDTRFSYYSFYYVTHAAYQLGDAVWGKTWKMSSDHLVSRQQEDGGWPQSRSGEEPGRIYATAMAVLTLSTPNALLPVNQR